MDMKQQRLDAIFQTEQALRRAESKLQSELSSEEASAEELKQFKRSFKEMQQAVDSAATFEERYPMFRM
ncbi:hypothetical protein [Salsuginibacillus kocurii]|uniref:hypothetical protein n=1 Tax=Salsuginibacillus kocurii TaxID=427078 RepID=UPI00037500C0|nr:hypothetical protein [Salsuginibacillus kocurii]